MTAPQSGVLRQVYKFKCRREQIREGWLGCPAFISVMEAVDLRKLHYFSELRRLYPPRDRSILVERQVSARPLVVFEIQLQDATQACFIQDDDVVQALAANRAVLFRFLLCGVRSDNPAAGIAARARTPHN